MIPDRPPLVTEAIEAAGWESSWTTTSLQEVRAILDATAPLIAAEALRWFAVRLESGCVNEWCGNTEPHVSYVADYADQAHGCLGHSIVLRNLADQLANHTKEH